MKEVVYIARAKNDPPPFLLGADLYNWLFTNTMQGGIKQVGHEPAPGQLARYDAALATSSPPP